MSAPDRGGLFKRDLASIRPLRCNESNVMFANPRSGCALVLIGIALGLAPDRASAITVEVAKKCNALIAKEFPPREPGNPAAGSTKGSGRDQRAFFDKCVANNGNMDDKATK
jgi:hypothetical protein